MKCIYLLLAGSIAAILLAGFTLNEPSGKTPQSGYDIITSRKIDTDGRIIHLGVENKKAYPVALVFLEVGCVISQRMIPELNNIYREAQEREVRFYGVISNDKASWQEAQAFKKEFEIQFPLLFDANGDLAQRIKPTVVPECFVFDKNDKLEYHGRINDQFVAVGKINKNARNNELRDAIQAVASGNSPLVSHQAAIGCVFQPWPTEGRELTYNKDIEPILRANCSSCHQPNDIGPFPLLTYEDVSRRGNMIEYVTRKKYMPIWKADKDYGKFTNEHRLSDHEINFLKSWVRSGMAEGKPENLMPPIASKTNEWKLGPPDLVLEMEPYDLPASGDDQYRVFVMKEKIPKGKTIRAIDFKAGDPSVVHHSTIFVDYTGKLRAYDKEDPKPGYDAFKKGGTMEFGSAVPVCGWAPGVGPYSYPDGVGFYVEEGAYLAFENHYHLSGKATTDKSYVGIYYADQPVNKYITGSIIGTQKLQIPAKSPDFKKSIWTYVPVDIELYDITPHMHFIGKSVEIDVQLPDGDTKNLLKLSDWDLRWQSVYTMRELTIIPKGSIIRANFVYDNSDDNADNPHYPSKEMYWGWGSEDEMCEVYMSYIPVEYKDYGKMLSSSFASFEHFYPASERIPIDEHNIEMIQEQFIQTDIWSDRGQKLLISLIESDMADRLLDQVKKEKYAHRNDPVFMVNLVELSLLNAYVSLDDTRMIREATNGADILYKFIKSGSAPWNTKMSYAKIMLESGIDKFEKEGIRTMEHLMEEQEQLPSKAKFSKVYWELGKYYYAHRNDAKAEQILQRGLTHHPQDADLQQELASDGRIVKKTLN
ncbi:MAG: redoxin domain-containing protein [Bacteroidota bacterium]